MKKKIVCLLLSFALLLSSALAGEFSAFAACSHSKYITYYDSSDNTAYKLCCLCSKKATVTLSSLLFAYADPIYVHKGENEVTVSLSTEITNCESGAIAVSSSNEIEVTGANWLFDSCNIKSFDKNKKNGVFSLSEKATVKDGIISLKFNVSDSAEDGALAYIKLDTLMYNARTNIKVFDIPIYIVAEHNYENNICTVCGCGGEKGENGCEWNTLGDTITFSGNENGELVFDGTPWNEFHTRVKKVIFNGNIKKLDDTAFAGLQTPETVEIIGNPQIENGTLPDGFTGKVRGFIGTHAEEYCKEKIEFENIEEFVPKGYQQAINGSTKFRINSQMRWAEYYDKAGFDIVAVDDDGKGNITRKSRNVNITTVYKSISGTDKSGNVITVFTPEKDCYASAINIEGLPVITDDRRIEFTFTPYVYNIYSDEKISLKPIYMAYTKDGLFEFVPTGK